jgi:hypothetical protein
MRLLALIALIAFAIGAAVAQPEFSVPLRVINSADSTTLFFGISHTGSFCFPSGDTVHGYSGPVILPPVPPVGVFDARFFCPVSRTDICTCFDQGKLWDLRRYWNPAQKDTFKLRAQLGSGSSVVLSWPAGLGSRFNSALLRYIGSSGPITIDMLTQTSAEISESGDPALALIYTSGVVLTAVQTPMRVPSQMLLLQNYPNPFNPSTAIMYEIGSATHVVLKVHDVLGREVATLVDGEELPGSKSIVWNVEGVAGGVYFCELRTAKSVAVTKLLLLR